MYEFKNSINFVYEGMFARTMTILGMVPNQSTAVWLMYLPNLIKNTKNAFIFNLRYINILIENYKSHAH